MWDFLHFLNQIKPKPGMRSLKANKSKYNNTDLTDLFFPPKISPLVNVFHTLTHCMNVRLLNGRQAGGICNREG